MAQHSHTEPGHREALRPPCASIYDISRILIVLAILNAHGAAETIYPTTTAPTTAAPTTGPPTDSNAIVGTHVRTDSSEHRIDTTTVLIIAAAAVGGLIVLVALAAVVCCCCIRTGNSRVEQSQSPAAGGGGQYAHRPSTTDWKSENMPKPQLTWSASWSELVGDEQGPSRARVNVDRDTGNLRPIRGRAVTTTATTDQPARPAAAASAKRPKPKSSIVLPVASPTPTDGLTAADRRCSGVTTTTLPILR